MITETFLVVATDADLLNAPSRLASIPYAGNLVLEAQASVLTATNRFLLTVEMPDGSTPVNGQLIPAGAVAGGGVLNADDKWQMSFAAMQGAHFTIGLVEVGTCVVALRVTLVP